ncbi:MAG: DUF1934 domain-containing protein [Oscillospiraceae bacterium]|nr:DUF1934 domain-containing protein [Oscillospiraceae bacterium]
MTASASAPEPGAFNCVINIKGTQRADGDTDRLSLSTLGKFYKKDDDYYISYTETEATGYNGAVTTLRVEADRRVTMSRTGEAVSQLTLEKGRKHMCHYDTGFGSFMLGVRADTIENRLTDKGGRLRLRYALDLNATQLSENELDITVRENKNNA